MSDETLTPPRGFRVKRVYDDFDPADGYRILVDRLWPRGVKKAEAHIDEWAKDVTPSTELRRWFHEDPEGRRGEFAERYAEELSGPAAQQELARLRERAANDPPVTLVTAVKEPGHSQLPVLLDQLRG
ncbi:MarR family transcriptional regulator [Nocardia donostiensis]|uniref:DUF488 domain-containing protein n=1 Tax=Nocardia donostiensis TaxID=1538463 RepID=UPI0009DA3148|nr:DUF488 family protein [Nocardia donostiensis]OQS17158.1 MarR family transcriptional regulator [Nocardia donostiensis]